MFSGWFSSEKPAEDGEADASGDASGKDVATVAKESGKAALDGIWNVVNKVASSVSEVPGIFAEFNAEEQKFKREKNLRHTDAAVPPWVGYNEEEVMRTQILALSGDKRNFLRNPPAGVQFHFDFNVSFPVATSILEEDPMLEKMRFELVPKQATEEVFWRNYFYRVSLIKQSSQLNTLAAQQQEDGKTSPAQEDRHSVADGSGNASPAVETSSNSDLVAAAAAEPEAEEANAEFISDDFVADSTDAVQEWEKELHQELKDLGMEELEDELGEGDDDGDVKDDAEWEKEIEAMLDQEESTAS